jgi:hypothetical protein
MWWIVGDLTKAGRPQGVTQPTWIGDMLFKDTPVFMKDSVSKTMDGCFIQQFPEGWRVDQ